MPKINQMMPNSLRVLTTLSSTITEEVQVFVFELISSTVRVVVVVAWPTSLQPKVIGSAVRVTAPQASEEPSSTAAAVVDPIPFASS